MAPAPSDKQQPVLAAIDDLVASYERAIAILRDNGLGAEVEALLPDHDYLLLLRGRLERR